ALSEPRACSRLQFRAAPALIESVCEPHMVWAHFSSDAGIAAGSAPRDRGGRSSLLAAASANTRAKESTMRAVVRVLLAVALLLFGTTRPTFAECSDPAAAAAVRAECDCASANNHGAYVSCVAHATNAAVKDGTLPEDCASTVMNCASNSTCGKPGFVTCCETDASGTTKCNVVAVVPVVLVVLVVVVVAVVPVVLVVLVVVVVPVGVVVAFVPVVSVVLVVVVVPVVPVVLVVLVVVDVPVVPVVLVVLVVVVVAVGSVLVVVATVLVVEATVLVVVPPPPPHSPLAHASQQLGCVPTHALPPFGAVHASGPFTTLHFVVP